MTTTKHGFPRNPARIGTVAYDAVEAYSYARRYTGNANAESPETSLMHAMFVALDRKPSIEPAFVVALCVAFEAQIQAYRAFIFSIPE